MTGHQFVTDHKVQKWGRQKAQSKVFGSSSMKDCMDSSQQSGDNWEWKEPKNKNSMVEFKQQAPRSWDHNNFGQKK